MKIFYLLLEPHLLFFFRFPKHKTGWGIRYPARVSSPPPTILDMPCGMLLRLIKECSYSMEILDMKIFEFF